MSTSEKDSVFELLTELCNNIVSRNCFQNSISPNRLSSKLRAHSYEIILKKTTKEVPQTDKDPVADLLAYYFVTQQNSRNVAEYKRYVELKKVISTIRQTDFGNDRENMNNVLKLLVGLSDSSKQDLSQEMYKNPFSFGAFEKMLPRPPREKFGSPEPYSYFPSHVFELPYSLRRQAMYLDKNKSPTSTEYTVQSYDSKSLLADAISRNGFWSDHKTFASPMSLGSMASTQNSPYSDSLMLNYPRLTAPRDIRIPTSNNESHVKVSFESSTAISDVKEVYRAQIEEPDIWELATQIDNDIPDDIWEIASKMPAITERQLIASCPREMAAWRKLYGGQNDLVLVSERQFIRHLMYLIIGIETSSFPFNQDTNSFQMKNKLVIEGVSPGRLRCYLQDLLVVGTYYKRLYRFAFNQSLEDHFHSRGLVYEAARETIRRYLLEFRLSATEIYEECTKRGSDDINCMPTLLQILFHMEPLKHEIETVASVFKVVDEHSDIKTSIPSGAELMSYLFSEISLVTHRRAAHTMFTALVSICKVYVKFIERFIFEGELDDKYNEFFIRKDSQYVNCRSKRYWDKGFHITQNVAVPEFLKPLAKLILLCGKSLRLLKLCNPSEPLVLLLSSSHPQVSCCASFEALQHQQRALEVYRTRCRFVCGPPPALNNMLLQREDDDRARAARAARIQAETVDKIIAERKRLAQLIVAEKQHSLRVLEAAMLEAKAAKLKSKQRERRRYQLEQEGEKATEEVDSRLRDDERNKIMEYYSKLNMEVEKGKMHTEWKIKRLQLDQSRIQLLSTEERNLKREKLEFVHRMNEEMAMSIQSIDYNGDGESKDVTDNDENEGENKMFVSTSSISDEVGGSSLNVQTGDEVTNLTYDENKKEDDTKCDNKKELDSQGNIVLGEKEVSPIETAFYKSSDVIGHNLDSVHDNLEYLKMKQDAATNKLKVMSHEFNQVDQENNQMKEPPSINLHDVDDDNNMTPFAEARRNKLKVLGDDFGLVGTEVKTAAESKTDAQREAVINKLKVLGVEYNLPAERFTREPVNEAQEEARRNKLKVLGDDFGLVGTEVKTAAEPNTDAQREAVINKLKVLGVEYNLPAERFTREPVNEAQEEAVRNKKKVLGSEYGDNNTEVGPRKEIAKRSGLTLNLKPYGDSTKGNLAVTTPNPIAVTPGELFPRLDLETPTTADVPLESALTCDIFTPQTENGKNFETAKESEKDIKRIDGFSFPIVCEDTVEVDAMNEITIDESPVNTPMKSLYSPVKVYKQHHPVFDLLDGTYNLDDFDPFGIKDWSRYSKDHFNSKMDEEMNSSCYTHPAIIMEEVKKSPYSNIFMTHFDSDKEVKVDSDNIASLTACLQRSVMLPLTYQLEVVNNSILTHFLVNLDMYEHLRSLRDYFFLMDGEFSRSICHNLFSKLTKTLNPQELLNFSTLHNILDKALGSSISHVHKFSENLSFTIAESPLSFQHSSPDVLQCLSLTYAVQWPLNIILSHEALQRYAKVFQFMLKMRRIFWVLGENFQDLKLSVKLSKQHSRTLLRSPHYISTQIYRHVMSSMVRALDNYIATTCILSSWKEFESDLKKATTLDDLYDCHVVYIKKVLFRCLLNNRSTPVMKLLNDMFTVILKFSRVLKAGEWQQKEPSGNFTHSSFAQLQELFHLFEKLAKYLHKVIVKLTECGYQRHLAELLTRINLNQYYDPEGSRDMHNSTGFSYVTG